MPYGLGSFTSSKIDPEDIDISPLYDRQALVQAKGQPGSNKIKNLVGHRARVVELYNVEPFPVPWQGVRSTLVPGRLTGDDLTYVTQRGGLDDWWQRVRPDGVEGAEPVPPTEVGSRGYVEVAL